MKGELRLFTVPAPSLQGNPLGDATERSTPIYLPPGYAEGTQRFPVAYFLHGSMADGLSWTSTSAFSPNVPMRLDALIASGSIPPLIAVFVDGWTALGGSQWINSAAIGRYRDYLAADVVGFVDRELRTLPGAGARALIGKSSGGYGALAMAKDPHQPFGHIACHSGDAYFEYAYLPEFPKAAQPLFKAGGVEKWYRDFLLRARATKMRSDDYAVINILNMAGCYTPRQGAPLGLELPFDLKTARIDEVLWQRWLASDPVRFVPRSVESFRTLKTLFIDCGSRDEFHLQFGARMVVDALREAKVEVMHEEFEDGHRGTGYRYERSLQLLVPRMA